MHQRTCFCEPQVTEWNHTDLDTEGTVCTITEIAHLIILQLPFFPLDGMVVGNESLTV